MDRFSKAELKAEIEKNLMLLFSEEPEQASDDQFYKATALMVRNILTEKQKNFSAYTHSNGNKEVYYLSMEFLMGRSLKNSLYNLEIAGLASAALEEMGVKLERLYEYEPDPGLGNGGLGRLAACYLDGLASQDYTATGYCILYEYGIFKQKIIDGWQTELPDEWLPGGEIWLERIPEHAVDVNFGGRVEEFWDYGYHHVLYKDYTTVKAVPYDIMISGYDGKGVSLLRVWSAQSSAIDMDAFNRGDYAAADRHRAEAEAISAILYPNDAGEHGRLLRLKQEYLFVSAGLSSVLDTFRSEHGSDWKLLPQYVAIHTNDTHPAMCGPELMRVLIDEEGLEWDEAWDITTKTISYTNHTILPEALEKWPIDTFSKLLPRLYMIIEEISRRWRDGFDRSAPDWQDRLRQTAVLWDGQVRMACLSVICSHSVNGVAKIHTDILKRDTLKDFYALTPEKFNNKTNGIAHRRFLAEANPAYAKLITEAIGTGWLDNADELAKLVEFENDPAFLEQVGRAKHDNKVRLANYVKRECGLDIDPNTIFDVQVKRFHAYKRQLLNIFKVMDIYNRRLADPNFRVAPTTFIFSGKAASSYAFAKETIRLINSVADVINNDSRVNGVMKVCFIPNFRVSNAQLIYPSAEISEQISTAGMEASGTSNMKLMMNGAITLGTMDGANIEIVNLAGRENEKIFGLTAPEVDELRASGMHFAWDMYNGDPDRLGRIIDELTDDTFAGLSGSFESIRHEIMLNNDADFVMKDFHSYVEAWEELTASYSDHAAWNKMALHNTASSGWFSSDRTIREYRDEIWGA